MSANESRIQPLVVCAFDTYVPPRLVQTAVVSVGNVLPTCNIKT